MSFAAKANASPPIPNPAINTDKHSHLNSAMSQAHQKTITNIF